MILIDRKPGVGKGSYPVRTWLAVIGYSSRQASHAGFEGKILTWEVLAYEANCGVSVATLWREMHQLDWWKRISYRKSWISPQHTKKRKE